MKEEDGGELQLVERLQGGDRAAMRRLYDCHVGYLAAVAARYIPLDDDVSDVLQEAFVKIFTSLGHFSYRGPGSLRAWMARIVVNEALDFLDRARHHEPLNDQLDGALDEEYEEPDIGQVSMDAIYEMIRGLPEGYRKVFNLYVFEGKSHREIAAMLGIKEDSSASQLHRAKALLAREINNYCNHHRQWTNNG